jgi:hypothetical protein
MDLLVSLFGNGAVLCFPGIFRKLPLPVFDYQLKLSKTYLTGNHLPGFFYTGAILHNPFSFRQANVQFENGTYNKNPSPLFRETGSFLYLAGAG